jgi:phospholipid/cholesterol/gamma-HCH transport system substrate-binding protein
MGRKGIETLVGGFVLLGIVGLVFLSLQAANLVTFFGQGDTYALQARFDNIGGLKPRAPVRSAGVTVGRITSIAIDPKTYEGVVTMAIDSRIRFPKDSAAKILTSGLLGDQYVGIEPGGDEQDLAAGERIVQTQGAVVLENLIGQFLFNRAADAGTEGGAKP